MSSDLADKIWIGPAGWAYPDWNDIVYPGLQQRAAHQLEHISKYFDTVEIDSSFEKPLRPEISHVWLRRVSANPRFQFTAKLYQGFTHQRTAGPSEERAFRDGIDPFLQAGRLGAVLLQFPGSFKNDPIQRRYLSGLLLKFREYPLVVEVRHASWNFPSVLDFASEYGVGICNLALSRVATAVRGAQQGAAATGYVRLHGRGYDTWFGENTLAGVRHDYLYTIDELMDWKDRIESIAALSQKTYVVLNNPSLGKSVVNALQLAAILYGKSMNAPLSLIERYPQLRAVTSPHLLQNSPIPVA